MASLSARSGNLKSPILWLPDAKSQLIGKDPNAGKDWGQEEKGTTEDEMMVGLCHWLVDMSLSKLWEIVKDGETWRAPVHGVTERQTWLSHWTTNSGYWLRKNQYLTRKVVLCVEVPSVCLLGAADVRVHTWTVAALKGCRSYFQVWLLVCWYCVSQCKFSACFFCHSSPFLLDIKVFAKEADFSFAYSLITWWKMIDYLLWEGVEFYKQKNSNLNLKWTMAHFFLLM